MYRYIKVVLYNISMLMSYLKNKNIFFFFAL